MPYDPKRHGPTRIVGPGFHERVFRAVTRVPEGFVTTYGDVGEALGSSRVARQVGYALAALPEGRRDVPWHRVVQGSGSVAPQREDQIARLREEGLTVNDRGKIARFAEVRIPVERLLHDEPRQTRVRRKPRRA